jgi:hypothetical protein
MINYLEVTDHFKDAPFDVEWTHSFYA